MKKTNVFLMVCAVAMMLSGTAQAEVIFGNTGGSNIGNSDYDLADLNASTIPTDTGFNGNRWNGGTRRASTGAAFFVGNWAIDPSTLISPNGFGGVDQVNGNGISGLLANDGVTTVATAFLNNGNHGGTGPTGSGGGGSGQGDLTDDTAPSGAFVPTGGLAATDLFGFTFDMVSNQNGNTEVIYDVMMSIDGGAFASIGSGVFDTVAAAPGVYSTFTSTPLSLGVAGSDFNVQVSVGNSGVGSPQIGARNLTITRTAVAVPEPSSLALLGLISAGVVARRRRK